MYTCLLVTLLGQWTAESVCRLIFRMDGDRLCLETFDNTLPVRSRTNLTSQMPFSLTEYAGR